MKISRKKLLSILSKIKTVKQVGVTYRKEAGLFLGQRVFAETRIVAYLNTNYAKAMRKKTGKPFNPMKRSWGELIEGTPLVRNGDKHYLHARVIRKSPPVYLTSDYREIKDSAILAALAIKDRHREEVVVIRDISLENITRLTLGGKVYTL